MHLGKPTPGPSEEGSRNATPSRHATPTAMRPLCYVRGMHCTLYFSLFFAPFALLLCAFA
jgi:hypothetical protein